MAERSLLLSPTAPDPQLSAALEEVERLREELKQAKAHAAPEQPANKATKMVVLSSILCSYPPGTLEKVPGIFLSTAAMMGTVEAHKTTLEKLGAKWSGKRSAYYIQAA